jgi:hypothetical protein
MNVQETLYNQKDAEIRQGEDSTIHRGGFTVLYSALVEAINKEAAEKYPYPKPCCRLKKMHVDGLREAYVKRMLND